MKKLITILVLVLSTLSVGCRPEACSPAISSIERVAKALDEHRLDAAANGLVEIESLLQEEDGYLGGFRERSRGLREVIERQHNLDRLDARDADAAQRQLPPLMEGWHREATAVKRRCRSYLI